MAFGFFRRKAKGGASAADKPTPRRPPDARTPIHSQAVARHSTATRYSPLATRSLGDGASPALAVPPEVLRQVKLLELRTRGLVNSLFSGEYRSVFKGQGMEFSEVREYQPGDEVRSIDWNVTAR